MEFHYCKLKQFLVEEICVTCVDRYSFNSMYSLTFFIKFVIKFNDYAKLKVDRVILLSKKIISVII